MSTHNISYPCSKCMCYMKNNWDIGHSGFNIRQEYIVRPAKHIPEKKEFILGTQTLVIGFIILIIFGVFTP